MTERKLASIQRIAEIKPIPEADLICAYRINGWWIVSKVNEFKVNDLVVYLEVDSFVPTELAPFLSKGKEPSVYNTIKGERLRTIRLKKQVSQGLILPLSSAVEKFYGSNEDEGQELCEFFVEDADVSELLGVTKWEKPEGFIAAHAKGNFPSFIPKTDQDRIQNLKYDFNTWQDQGMLFEKTEKIDGSSITVFVYNELQGVCSRNLELKEDFDNSWWKLAQNHDIINKIKQTGRNLAVQGEIYGSSINGNLYKLNDQRFMVYDIYDIDNKTYLLPDERWKLVEQLGLPHVPLVGFGVLVGSPSDLLDDAEGKSTVNESSIREGYVYKSMSDSNVSFKCISNAYLLKHE